MYKYIHELLKSINMLNNNFILITSLVTNKIVIHMIKIISYY